MKNTWYLIIYKHQIDEPIVKVIQDKTEEEVLLMVKPLTISSDFNTISRIILVNTDNILLEDTMWYMVRAEFEKLKFGAYYSKTLISDAIATVDISKIENKTNTFNPISCQINYDEIGTIDILYLGEYNEDAARFYCQNNYPKFTITNIENIYSPTSFRGLENTGKILVTFEEEVQKEIKELLNPIDYPYSFIKLHWDSTLYNYGYEVISYVNGKPKVNKNKLREFVDEILLGEGFETSETLQYKFDEYNKSKSGSKLDKMVYNSKHNKNKIPDLIISNKWEYLMGKIGSTSATFVTIKKDSNSDNWFNNPINGYEIHGVKISDKKSINNLPSSEALVFGPYDSFGDGDEYKVIQLSEIHKYLSSTEKQQFYVYLIR